VVLPVGALLVAMQLVPYGWSHPNPPVTAPVSVASPEAQRLLRESCADCHTNETRWPWYSHVAPMSWLVRWDVEQGRDAMNLSTGTGELDEAHDAVEDGSMPPARYVLIHRSARLTGAEREVLRRALDELDERGDGDDGEDGGGRDRRHGGRRHHEEGDHSGRR
jgi:hypothetical protein